MVVSLVPITASDQLDEIIDDGLTPLLHQLQELDVWDEQGNIRSASQVNFAYQNWRSVITPQVFRNRSEITSGFTADFSAGTLTIAAADLTDADEILCSYSFSYFTRDNLSDYLQLALNTINNQRSKTAFTFASNSVPEEWFTVLAELAYAHALETLLMDMLTWKGDLIWRDPRAVASYVQGILSRLWATWAQEKRELKGRRFLTPRATASGRWRFPRTVTGSNFTMFTVIRG